MKRIGKVVVGVLLLMPAVAQAQRPSATMQTRSALLYLDRAERSQVVPERKKLYDQALEMAVEAVKAQPANSKTWFTLGQVFARTGDALGADSAFDKAETLWPEYTKETEDERIRAYVTAFNAGVTAIQENNLAEAAVKLEAAAAVYGKRPTAALNLGNLYARTNQLDQAADAYTRALVIMRGPERATLDQAEEKQWSEWEEAASFNLAQILATSGKNEEAAQAYVDFLKRNPTNIMARSNLAVVYARSGKKEDAARVYQELLGQDLSDEDYFAVGVGLFRGEQYATAAQAFRKALTKNTALRDAYYNLAQALYSEVSPLEEERSRAKAADLKTIDAQLKPMYEELQSAAEKARTLDPNNRNILALLARGYRGMADIVDAKAANEWKMKTLDVLKVHQDLPFEVTEVALVNEGGEVKVSGNIVNLKVAEGSPIKLKLSFLGKDGSVLGTQDVTVTAPKTEDQVEFKASLKTSDPIGGWKYEPGV